MGGSTHDRRQNGSGTIRRVSDDDDDKPSGWSQFRDGKIIDSADSTSTGRDWAPRLIVAGLALLAAVIFIVQNNNRVKTDFLFFNFKPRLWVVIVVSVLLGALLGQAVGLLRRRIRHKDKVEE
jgi:uncharacterized integral membrane protein